MQTLDKVTRFEIRRKILREIAHRERLRDRAPALRAHFREFSRDAWHVVEPAYKFIPNWHIDAICDHLQAVADEQIQNLIINIPPGHAKSLLVAVQWPAWMWIRETKWKTAAAWRALFGSYAEELSIRDSLRTRSLIDSAWYRDMFSPQWSLTKRKDDNLETSATGFRLALTVGGKGTGFRGDARIVDDALKVTDAHIPSARKKANDWWDKTMSSRLNNLATGASIIMGHRLHEDDLSGYKIAHGTYTVLSLPSEFDPERRAKTFLSVQRASSEVIRKRVAALLSGNTEPQVASSERPAAPFFEDPRTERGELLFPALFPRAVIEQAKVDLGSYGYAGQHQQLPAPESGGIFKREQLQRYKESPTRFDQILIGVDAAFKDAETSDFVAIIAIGISRARFHVLDLSKAQMGFDVTEAAIRDMRAKWTASEPRNVAPWAPFHTGSVSGILIEEAANGAAIIERAKRDLPGVVGVPTEGGKFARAWSCQPTVEAEQVYIPLEAPWAGDFIQSLCTFPNAKYDDDVDAFTHVLAYVRKHMHGLLGYYREQAEALKVAKVQQSAFTKPEISAETPACPKCGSAAIAGIGSVLEGDNMREQKRCGQCGNQWLK